MDNPGIQYAKIGYERIATAIEVMADELSIPPEHYDAFCKGMLTLLYSLPPPKKVKDHG
jgi:hypothetical protein